MAEPIFPPNDRMGSVHVVTAVLMVLPVLLPQSRIGAVQVLIALPIGLAILDTVAAIPLPQPLRVCWAASMALLRPVWIFAPACTAKPLSLETAVLAKPPIFAPNGFHIASTPSRLLTSPPRAPERPVNELWPRLMLEKPAANELAIVLNDAVVFPAFMASSDSAALRACFASASFCAA